MTPTEMTTEELSGQLMVLKERLYGNRFRDIHTRSLLSEAARRLTALSEGVPREIVEQIIETSTHESGCMEYLSPSGPCTCGREAALSSYAPYQKDGDEETPAGITEPAEAGGDDRFLVCDECGAIYRDDDAALSESCKCGRFKQRMEWATNGQIAAELTRLTAEVERLKEELENA
jgi:hypothetical protein